jgi:CheY-like chemotaxis protein
MEILLIEDNSEDVRLVQEALKVSGNKSNLTIEDDGKNAVNYLINSESALGATRPDLIILDLKLPGMSGRELLEFLKKDERFKTIPVVVMTDSDSVKEITEAYNLKANCYVIKPRDSALFMKYVISIDNFWSNTVIIPRA